MSYEGRSILAVVPARGGSKGIPGKNIRTVGGISLVGHAARVLRELPWVDAAVLSTDDEAIAAEGRRVGLDVPFMRPDRLATDECDSTSMWQHAWIESERHYGRTFDISVLLQPTSPLREPAHVEATVRPVALGPATSACTITPTPGHYTPFKARTVEPDGMMGHFMPEGQRFARRQDVPTLYFPNGYAYAVTREKLLDQGEILGELCAAVVIGHPVVDIDEPWELDWAEYLWSRRAR